MPLRNCCSKITDGTHDTPKPARSGIPFLTAIHIKDNWVDYDSCLYLTAADHAVIFQRCDPEKNDVLMVNIGAGVATSALVDVDYEFSLKNVALLKPDSRLMVGAYLNYSLSQRKSKITQDLSSGGAQPFLSLTQIGAIEIPLPSTKAEQEAIAEALGDTDALIEALEQLIAKKRQLKQGAMQELLTGKRRLPGFSGEWRTALLGDVIIHCSSGATPYRGKPEFYKGIVKWITSGELNYNVITDTIEHISQEAVEKTNLKIHPSGTFLMAITGLEAAGTRGSCGIVGSPACTNQSCMAIYPTPELKTEYLFHYYVLRGNDLAFQYCQGTKQQSYTAKLVKLLPIDLPPTSEEQTAIAQILTEMDAEIAELESKLSKACTVKQGMMQQLLTGKIRLVVNPKPIIDNG